jgi:DNA polymerase I
VSHQSRKKLILIDGNAVIHRSFHALPPFKNPEGQLVNAVYGFASLLLNLMNYEKPEYIATTFDLKGPTFRHEQYKEYKATRKKAPDELYAQFPLVKELVRSFQIPIFEKQGFEADDLLGTLSALAEKKEGILTYIVTGDLDTLQLVSDHTKVYTLTNKYADPVIYDADKVFARYGLTPAQVTDMKGLQGDSSDNIKGVAGVGAKTTKDLLQKFGSIENVYENLDDVKESTRRKLEADRDSAFQSKELATIICDVPDVTLDLEACLAHDYDQEVLINLFQNFGFRSLIKRLTTFNKSADEKRIEASGVQASLF